MLELLWYISGEKKGPSPITYLTRVRDAEGSEYQSTNTKVPYFWGSLWENIWNFLKQFSQKISSGKNKPRNRCDVEYTSFFFFFFIKMKNIAQLLWSQFPWIKSFFLALIFSIFCAETKTIWIDMVISKDTYHIYLFNLEYYVFAYVFLLISTSQRKLHMICFSQTDINVAA